MTRHDRIAVIGLGAMGLPIALNLQRAGVDVIAFDAFPAAVDRARAQGLDALDALEQVDARTILTVLPDMPQVREVLDSGLSSRLQAGDIVVIMGTVSPVLMQELHDELAQAGVITVDAAMSGGDVGAQTANMAIMFGGPESVFQELLPTFEKIASTIRRLGEVGSGQVAKACNQVVVAVTLTALAEALTLAKRNNLDIGALLDVLQGGLAGSQVLKVKREKIESEDFTPGGRADFQLKDLRFAIDVAARSHSSTSVTREVARLFEELVEHGDGLLDHSAIIREIARQSEQS